MEQHGMLSLSALNTYITTPMQLLHTQQDIVSITGTFHHKTTNPP
jgi:hypothetical protein